MKGAELCVCVRVRDDMSLLRGRGVCRLEYVKTTDGVSIVCLVNEMLECVYRPV